MYLCNSGRHRLIRREQCQGRWRTVGLSSPTPRPVDGSVSVGAHVRPLSRGADKDNAGMACAAGHQLSPIRKQSRLVPVVDQHFHARRDYVRTTAACSAEYDCRQLIINTAPDIYTWNNKLRER
jgi:hypothetical protein